MFIINSYAYVTAGTGSINLDFINDSYDSHGTNYGSFAAYLAGTGSTFSRPSIGTYYNSSGVLSTAAIDTARIGNHDPANSNAEIGLLIEAATNNACRNSEAMGSWSLTNTTITANTTTAPDGNSTADKVAESNTSNVFHQIDKATPFTFASGTAVVFSVFVKAAERSKCCLLMSNELASAFLFYQFDLSAVSVGSAQTAGAGWTAGGAGITSVGNGWYRLWIRGSLSSTDEIRGFVEINNASAARQYAGSTGSGLYVWGGQIEGPWAAPSSYVPANATAEGRNADAFTIALPSGTHDLTITFDDNSTQAQNGKSGNFLLPTSLNRPNIKSIVGVKL